MVASLNKLVSGFNPSIHLPRGENNEYNHRQSVARRLRNRNFELSIPKIKCDICEYVNKEKPWHFDFHHKDPKSKKFGIGGMGNSNHTLKQMKEELDKCILLCKLCHADLNKKQAQNLPKGIGWR